MGSTFLFIGLAALVPLVMGFTWYHPKLFGTAWMKGTGLSEEVLAKGPKPVVFLFAYLLSFALAAFLYANSAHVFGLNSLFASAYPDTYETNEQFLALVEQFKDQDRNFGHGAFHGVFVSLFVVFPAIATNGMFEMKNWKHNAINVGYWVVTMALMGGIVCQFA